jgi:hypothetical protein
MSNIIFCAECGTGLYGAKFCPQCGTLTDDAPVMAGVSAANGRGHAATELRARPAPAILPKFALPPPQHRSPASPAAPESRPPSRPRPPMLRGLVGLLLIAVAVVLVLSSGGGGPSYAKQAKAALRPVIGANQQLTASLSSLRSPSSAAGARSTVLSTLSAVQAAQRKLSTLKPGSGGERFATAAQGALSSERSFLNAADTVLGNPSSPSVDNLATLGNGTNTELVALDVDVPGASASFTGGSAISTWAQRQTAVASKTALLRVFATDGVSLINRRPHFRRSVAASRASRSRKRRRTSAT